MIVRLTRTHLILFLFFFSIMPSSSYYITKHAPVRVFVTGIPADFLGLSILVTHPIGWVFLAAAVAGISLINVLIIGRLLEVFRNP